MSSFVERHQLWDPVTAEAAKAVQALADEWKLETVRVSFPDQHGILRGKTLMVGELGAALRDGVTMTTTLLLKDTAHRTVYPVWRGGAVPDKLVGAGNFLMLPDPRSFRVLPWAPGTGWMRADIYYPDGTPVELCTRRAALSALDRLAEAGFDYVSGLEVEFHLFRLEDAELRPEHATQPGEPPAVSLTAQGFQYLTESRADELAPITEIIRRDVQALDLPLRTIEVEFGPSQVEFTFAPLPGIESADAMVLFRSAVKQIARRHGYHASFMCRPNLPNLFSSGWHLHQSLIDRQSGRNAFTPRTPDEPLSETGRRFIAGLLSHAAAACVFTTPTVNGYKRYRPHALAPDRILWGRDNRGAMLRVLGGADDPATRIENRVGEPAANPYLYLASQIASGLDGIARELEPDTPSDAPYEAAAQRLPTNLAAALEALRSSSFFRESLGDVMIDYILTLKDAELARFLGEVTDWEHREYFASF